MPSNRQRNSRNGMKSNNTSRRHATFDEYFSKIYGARWPILRAALINNNNNNNNSPPKVALWNKYCQIPFTTAMPNVKRVNDNSLLQVFSFENNNNNNNNNNELSQPQSDEFNIKAFYLLEYTSALLVEQLNVGPFDIVLDLCAGTGEKSILIAQLLSNDGVLISNEFNNEKCKRLRRTIKEYIPSNYIPVNIMQREPIRWYDPCTYNCVLVNVPCSNERRLLSHNNNNNNNNNNSNISFKDWNESITEQFSKTQIQLLLRGIESCKAGGCIVYSTTSISPKENDNVIENILKCTRSEIKIKSPNFHIGESTKYGSIILPDICEGYGPMYCAIIYKISDTRELSESDESESESDNEE